LLQINKTELQGEPRGKKERLRTGSEAGREAPYLHLSPKSADLIDDFREGGGIVVVKVATHNNCRKYTANVQCKKKTGRNWPAFFVSIRVMCGLRFDKQYDLTESVQIPVGREE
jgi:hypothetical protein